MKNETILQLPSDFKIHIDYAYPERKINEATKLHIEEIWKKELVRTRGKLFNGTLLSAHEFDGRQLNGHFVEYKYYLAQTRDPSLEAELHVQPICVCGHTTANDCILIGKRSGHVTEYQNFYELVPAGGIDTSAVDKNNVDVIKQLKTELKEEAGIEAPMILGIVPSFLIHYPQTFTYEICAKIELDPSAKNLVADRDDEYTELLWIPKNSMKEFVIQHRKEIIPLSLQLLELFP